MGGGVEGILRKAHMLCIERDGRAVTSIISWGSCPLYQVTLYASRRCMCQPGTVLDLTYMLALHLAAVLLESLGKLGIRKR